MRLKLMMKLLLVAVAIIATISAEESIKNINYLSRSDIAHTINQQTKSPLTISPNLTIMPYKNMSHIVRMMPVGLSMSGTVFEDMNKNAIFDRSEHGIAGWKIILKTDNAEIANTVSNGSGMYSFTNLKAGNYTITEDQKVGWIQSAPGSGLYNLTLTDKDAYNLNFGNFELEKVRAMPNISYEHPIMRLNPTQLKIFRETQINLTPTLLFRKVIMKPATYTMGTGAPTGSHFDLLSYLPYTPSERYQGSCGNCWVWGSTGCIEIDRAVRFGIKERLSTQYLNSNYNGGTGCGFSCCGGWPAIAAQFYNNQKMAIPWSDANAQFQDAGKCCGQNCCSDCTGCTGSRAQCSVTASSISTNPNYAISSIKTETVPTKGIGKEAAIANIKNVLNQNKAVTFCYFLSNKGWDVFFDFWDNQPETAVWHDQLTGSNGGHCITCVGYDDTDPNNRYWIMVNSWGAPAKRPNGIFRVSMDLNYDDDAYSWDTFDILSATPSTYTALYRWYNSGNGDHFYTTDPNGELAPSSGYTYEGIVGYIATSQISGTAALYRWYNSGNGDHFYTTDPNGELAPSSGYTYEGIVGYIATSQISGTAALYRWYNSGNGDHFYTTDPSGELAPSGGYTSEGITGYVWDKLIPAPTFSIAPIYRLINPPIFVYHPISTLTALYRWYNSGNGDHFYTTDPSGELAPSGGYTSEGITGYISTSKIDGTTSLYRWYNSGNGDHFYTTDPSGELAPSGGYTSEGITGYIATSQISGTTPLYRWYNSGNGDHFYTTDPSGELAPSGGYTSEGITGYIWVKSS